MHSHTASKTHRARPAVQRAASARATPPNGGNREDMIRAAAYRFYEQRGCVYGHALEDWLQAEAQVDAELGSDQKPADAEPGGH